MDRPDKQKAIYTTNFSKFRAQLKYFLYNFGTDQTAWMYAALCLCPLQPEEVQATNILWYSASAYTKPKKKRHYVLIIFYCTCYVFHSKYMQ